MTYDRIIGTRVGVDRKRDPEKATCQRCGRTRSVHHDERRRYATGPYCQDCRTSDPAYHVMVGDGLFGRKTA